MAGTVGIAKSSVSRRFIRASRDALEALMGRRFDGDILAVWIDGIIVDDHHILAAVGVDAEGRKHLLGLPAGLERERAGGQGPALEPDRAEDRFGSIPLKNTAAPAELEGANRVVALSPHSGAISPGSAAPIEC
jgi:hypothetical protein